jgi:diguanylate cyclase (GGDEF)-like protein
LKQALSSTTADPKSAQQGRFYQIEYCVRAGLSADPQWVEESGRCFADADGNPLYAQGVVRSIDARHARDQKLLELAQSDPLTGTLNRTGLAVALENSIEDAGRFRTTLGFMLISVDHLSRINDAFGFDVADEVIETVSQRLRTRLRGGDVLGRFSGNKFGVILNNCSADEMKVAADRFLAAMRNEVVETKSGSVAVTTSIGGVSAPRYVRTCNDAMARAQEALDMVRRQRRGSFMAWQPNVAREVQRRANIRVTDQIVTALNERRLKIAFEPVVRTSDRVPAFYECLVRLDNGEGDLSLAPDIVPIAEKLGLIRLVDHRVLELVIEELAASPHVQLSLNISPETTTDPDWWSTIEAMMQAHPHVAERLIVEITETVAIQDLDDVRGFVTRVKNFGGRIAIDDFGAGYTSFRNLRKLGVDLVKIDGAFVQNMTSSTDDRAFVQTLIDLAHRLNLETVAEWVQDDEAASMLSAWGCNFIQGRLIGLAETRRPWIAQAKAS